MSSPSKVEPAGLDREGLEHERARLEGLLALDEAWRALKQLDERQRPGEATDQTVADALRASLERKLASNRLYCVYREVVAKLAAPETAQAHGPPVSETGFEGVAAEAFRTKVKVKPTGASTGIAQTTGYVATGFVAAGFVAADDLTRIRGLTRPVAERLKSLGVSRFETIARWTRADIDRISAALGLGRTIVRQSWVDQAAILMLAPPAIERAPVTRTAAAALPTPARPAVAPAAAPIETPNPYDSRIDLIDGLTPDAVAVLANAGVTRTAQIAAFKADDVRRWKQELGGGVRGPVLHVIEQAAMLAGGHLPAAAKTKLDGRVLSLVPAPQPSGWGRPLLLERLRRDREEAARPRTPDETDRIARRSLREALAGGNPMRATAGATVTTARTRLVDRLAMIDLPRQPRSGADDVVAAVEERMAALQRELDAMERRLRSDPGPRFAAAAGQPSFDSQPPSSAGQIAQIPAAAALPGDTIAAIAAAAPAAAGVAASTGPVVGTAVEVASTPTPTGVAQADRPAAVTAQADATVDVPAAAGPPHAVGAAATSPAAAPPSTALPVAEPVVAPETAVALPSPAAALAPATGSMVRPAAEPEPETPLGPGEADVVIVAKAAPVRPADTSPALRSPPPVVSAESLAKRLRRFGAADPIEAEAYAAYHAEVEEAAVEIVRGPRPAAVPKSIRSAPTETTEECGERNSAIRRFVRALSGGGP